MGGPLGRYSDIAAAVVGVGVVVVWLAAHALLIVVAAFGLAPVAAIDTSQLDLAGVLALGIVLGQRATTNGAAVGLAATNLRLDAIGAPPAAVAATIVAPGARPPDGASGAH